METTPSLRSCSTCGASFEAKKPRKTGPTYCSQPCRERGRVPRDRRQPPMVLTCSHCGITFQRKRNRVYGGGERAFCAPACKGAFRQANGESAAAALKSYYKRRYGLTIEEANVMRTRGCDICGTLDWPGRHAQGHVDHDHASGQVRGILCSECNTGLGKFRDDPTLLLRAAEYLRSPR